MPEGIWELDLLTDLKLLRSGIETYKYPGNMPAMPAAAASQMVTGSTQLGVFTMLEEQVLGGNGGGGEVQGQGPDGSWLVLPPRGLGFRWGQSLERELALSPRAIRQPRDVWQADQPCTI